MFVKRLANSRDLTDFPRLDWRKIDKFARLEAFVIEVSLGLDQLILLLDRLVPVGVVARVARLIVVLDERERDLELRRGVVGASL